MTPLDILDRIREAGSNFTLERDHLVVDPTPGLTDADRDLIQRHRPSLTMYLRQAHALADDGTVVLEGRLTAGTQVLHQLEEWDQTDTDKYRQQYELFRLLLLAYQIARSKQRTRDAAAVARRKALNRR